jgi:hypothetical protein
MSMVEAALTAACCPSGVVNLFSGEVAGAVTNHAVGHLRSANRGQNWAAPFITWVGVGAAR